MIIFVVILALLLSGCSGKKYNLQDSFPVFPAKEFEIDTSNKATVSLGSNYSQKEFDKALKNAHKYKDIVFKDDENVVKTDSINKKKAKSKIVHANTCGGLLHVFFKNGMLEIYNQQSLQKQVKISQSVEDSLCNNTTLFFLTGDKLYSSNKLNVNVILESSVSTVLFKSKHDIKRIQKVGNLLIFPFANGNIEVFDLQRLDIVDRYSADFGKYNAGNYLLFNPKIIEDTMIFATTQYGLFAFNRKSYGAMWNLENVKLQSEIENFDKYLFMVANEKLICVDLYNSTILNSFSLGKKVKFAKILQLEYEKLVLVTSDKTYILDANMKKIKSISVDGKSLLNALNYSN